MQKNYLHNPTHLFLDDSPYFITAAIYQKRPLLQNPELKKLLLNRIKHSFNDFHWILQHWVILDDHYHLLAVSKNGKDLVNIMTQIHSYCGFHIKHASSATGRIWWNYWDYCPRDEKDYWVRLNYLLNNPIKHGYTQNLNDYEYSSFHETISLMGRDKLITQFKDNSEYKSLILEEDDF